MKSGHVATLAVLALSWSCLPTGGGSSSSTSSSMTDSDVITSVTAALNGNPDSDTIAAAETYRPALTAEENQYLEQLDWSLVTKDTAVADPVISKALTALSKSSSSSLTGKALTFGGAQVSPKDFINFPQIDTKMYDDAVKAMKDCYGQSTCNGAMCPASVLAAHLKTYGPIGSPPISPGYADKGSWQCTVEFFKGGAQPPDGGAPYPQTAQCELKPFCRNEEVIFPGGKSICHDPGWSPGPNPQNCGAKLPPSNSDCSYLGIPNQARVPACDCTIGVGTYSTRFDDPQSRSGGHWCCSGYSTGPSCTTNLSKSSCWYVDAAPSGGGCCFTLPTAAPPKCSFFNDPTIQPQYNGAAVCCTP